MRDSFRHAEEQFKELMKIWSDYVEAIQDPEILARIAPKGAQDAGLVKQIVGRIRHELNNVEGSMQQPLNLVFSSRELDQKQDS